jgi:hypothetical protein
VTWIDGGHFEQNSLWNEFAKAVLESASSGCGATISEPGRTLLPMSASGQRRKFGRV